MFLYDSHFPDRRRPEESGFYYWFLFMKLVDDYGPDHWLWPYFGDLDCEFFDWWARTQDRFMVGRDNPVESVDNIEEFVKAHEQKALVVRIDRGMRIGEILAELQDVLKENNFKRHRGRKTHQEEARGKYPSLFTFDQRPNIRKLKILYKVWCDRHRPVAGKLTLYEIGQTIPELAGYLLSESGHRSKDAMNAMVSRYLREAEHVVANVALGKFPNYRKPEPDNDWFEKRKAEFETWHQIELQPRPRRRKKKSHHK